MPLSGPAVVYDVTRLVTRGLNLAPNGIDRVDFALARHFIEAGATPLACAALGPRLADRDDALAAIAAIEAFWREDADVSRDAVYLALVAALTAPYDAARRPLRLARRPAGEQILRNGRALLDWGLRLGRPPTAAPAGAVYLNATQFLLDRPWYVHWLTARPDVSMVAFVHDLLQVDHPEFFRPREAALHPRRNRAICRRAAGVLAASETVARRFERFAAENGRHDLPVRVAPLPPAPVFTLPQAPPEELAGADYFVVCGTIEPRKNHLLLFNVWRELARTARPPKLVVVGKRGWLNETVVDMMSRAPALRASVIEAGGLSTPGLRRLIAGARALLMPSFGEGFGLPVVETLACGAPVIASDLAVFRETAGDAPDYLDPLDGPGWRQAVRDYAEPGSRRRAAALSRMAGRSFAAPPSVFFETVEAFLADLRNGRGASGTQ